MDTTPLTRARAAASVAPTGPAVPDASVPDAAVPDTPEAPEATATDGAAEADGADPGAPRLPTAYSDTASAPGRAPAHPPARTRRSNPQATPALDLITTAERIDAVDGA
ncbi:MAG: hypothetical protein GXX79_10200 [Actinomycetales bacterium]|nr:hypothetical protein [Actinomycetales bacterium]